MLRRTFCKAVAFFVAACTLPVRAKQETDKTAVSGVALMQQASPARGPKIPVGAVITCPNCGEHIAKALRNIFREEMGRSAAFENLNGHILAGSSFKCPECRTLYVRTGAAGCGEMHTDRGWL